MASFGDNFAKTPGAKELVVTDTVAGTYKKLVVNADGSVLLGGILVGDAAAYGTLLQLMQTQMPVADPSIEFVGARRQRCCPISDYGESA